MLDGLPDTPSQIFIHTWNPGTLEPWNPGTFFREKINEHLLRRCGQVHTSSTSKTSPPLSLPRARPPPGHRSTRPHHPGGISLHNWRFWIDLPDRRIDCWQDTMETVLISDLLDQHDDPFDSDEWESFFDRDAPHDA